MTEFWRSYLLGAGFILFGTAYLVYNKIFAEERNIEFYDKDREGYANTIIDHNWRIIFTNTKELPEEFKNYKLCPLLNEKITNEIYAEEFPTQMLPSLEACLQH